MLCSTFVRPPTSPRLLRLAARTTSLMTPSTWVLRRILTGGDPSLATDVKAALATVSTESIGYRLRALADVDVAAELASLEVPMLALAGTRDLVVPLRCVHAMQAVQPALEVASTEGPHLLLQTRSQWAWGAIQKFCR